MLDKTGVCCCCNASSGERKKHAWSYIHFLVYICCMGSLACLSLPQARLEASALQQLLPVLVASWRSPTHTLPPVYLEFTCQFGVQRLPIPCQQSLLTLLPKVSSCRFVQTPFSTDYMSWFRSIPHSKLCLDPPSPFPLSPLQASHVLCSSSSSLCHAAVLLLTHKHAIRLLQCQPSQSSQHMQERHEFALSLYTIALTSKCLKLFNMQQPAIPCSVGHAHQVLVRHMSCDVELRCYSTSSYNSMTTICPVASLLTNVHT